MRAFLVSSNGRLVSTFSGLRNSAEARSTVAGAGNFGGSAPPDLVFGSPGDSTAYVLVSR